MPPHLLPAYGREGAPYAGEEQAQVVVDFRRRAHRGARVSARRFLFNGDSGRQSLDEVAFRLVHSSEKLPRVGREAFHISPLPFGIERVEGERRLSRTRQARDDHELVARNVYIDIFQVVGARAFHADGVGAVAGLLLWHI